MKKKMMVLLLSSVMALSMVVGYAAPIMADETEKTVEETAETEETSAAEDAEEAEIPEDGTYSALFETDNSMFHVNETCDGRGVLTVKDGKMTIHVSLASKKIVNLFFGSAEDAQKDGAELLEPTEDEVTYDDGMTEVVYGFDIPVPELDKPFAVALIGTKGKWYDHEVIVSDPQAVSEES